MSFDLDALERCVARHGRVTRVVIAAIKGSSPREVGASMLVWSGACGPAPNRTQQEGQSGTIGGGALEFELAAAAREQTSTACVLRRVLGPDLGQCCGGALTLVSEVYTPERLREMRRDIQDGILARPVQTHATTAQAEMPLRVRRLLSEARASGLRPQPQWVDGWLIEPLTRPTLPLWIWGAGHVGRAMVDVIAPLPDVDLTWVDTGPERFPDRVPDHVSTVATAAPVRLVDHAPQNGCHLILTYSHALDLALCNALLARGFLFAGLIGSATKWARFRHRLMAQGHSRATVERITCPIGDPSLGKHPQMIAIGVAAALLKQRAQEEQRPDHIRQGNREDRRA